MPRKIRALELARVGKWGLDGSEITRQDIAELAETFAGKRPVIVGHGTDRAPKFGDVLDCWASADGNRIIGPVMFSDIGDKLFEGGYYDGWSISMPRRETDGKRVLHHLAILGAVPPKIPGLEELAVMAADFGENAAKDAYQFSGKIREEDNGTMMTDEEKKTLAEKDAEIAGLKAKNKAFEEAAQKAPETPAAESPAAAPAADAAQNGAAGNAAAGSGFSDMQKELAAIKADRRRERLEGFGLNVASKLPAGVAAKAKALAAQVEADGTFDFADNGKTEKRDALWLLGEILQCWPQPVRTGASGINYGDGAEGEKPVDWSAAAKKM